MVALSSDRKEVTMPALAEVLSTVAPNGDPRVCDLPTCTVCADSMVAAEASAFVSENVVSYLWTCDTCGYGFVTSHSLKKFVAVLPERLIGRACSVMRVDQRAARSPSAHAARVRWRKSSKLPCAMACRMSCIRLW